jgi:hypothetical protein
VQSTLADRTETVNPLKEGLSAAAEVTHLHVHEIRPNRAAAVTQPAQTSAKASGVRSLQASGSAQAASFGHDFSQTPVNRSDPSDIGIAVGDASDSDTGVTVRVQIVSGSKPAPGQAGEDKIYGGMSGGHVVINMGADGVLGFTNDVRGGHFFSKKKSKNSKFEHYSQAQWETKIKGKQVVTFEIHLTAEQAQTVKQAFEGEPAVDYSVVGYRCASYALRALEDAGVVKGSHFSIKYFLAPTPTALIRFLERQGYKPKVQHGSKKRTWNKRFKGAGSGSSATDE